MEKIKIMAFVGKSGAGKDYVMRKYAENLQAHIIVPCTSRPKREYEIEGQDYYFCDTNEFAAGDFVDTTVFNDWFYGTRFKDLNPDKVNVGVYSPAAVKKLAADERIELSIVHIKASAKTRLLRQLNREKDPNVKEIIRRFGTDEADFADADKVLPQLTSKYYYYWNDEAVGQE